MKCFVDVIKSLIMINMVNSLYIAGIYLLIINSRNTRTGVKVFLFLTLNIKLLAGLLHIRVML